MGYWPFSLLRRPGMRQFVKFGFVGASNTLLDFGIYASLTRLTEFFSHHLLTANAISFTVAVSNSYFLNKHWTFRDTGRKYHIQFAKFFLSNCVALGINELILFALVSVGVYDILAKALAICVSLFWNFFINKYWVFPVSGDRQAPPSTGG